jgi:PilZ domain-containing protein
MDHRWGVRRQVSLPVRLRAMGEISGWGRMRDASLSGAYIETAANPPTRMLVELDWIHDCRHVRCVLPAYIIRRDDDGLAVEWCEFAPSPFSALLALESSEPLPAPHVGSRLTGTSAKQAGPALNRIG